MHCGRFHKKIEVFNASLFLFAEREGFEPPVPLSTSVFKTDAIDHSAIFPSKKRAKVLLFFDICKFFSTFAQNLQNEQQQYLSHAR